jgi:hypothetical protein
VCGRCGRKLVGERIVKRSGLVFTYYRCGRRRQDHVRCAALALRERDVTEAIEVDLARLALPEETARWFRTAVEEWAAAQRNELNARVLALGQDIEQAEADLKRMTDLVIRGTLGEQEFSERRCEVQRRLETLRAALANPEAELEVIRAGINQALEEGTGLRKAFSEGSTEERRDLLARTYEHPVVRDACIMLVLRFPFTLLVDAGEVDRPIGHPESAARITLPARFSKLATVRRTEPALEARLENSTRVDSEIT